jgi:hypothetical protein
MSYQTIKYIRHHDIRICAELVNDVINMSEKYNNILKNNKRFHLIDPSEVDKLIDICKNKLRALLMPDHIVARLISPYLTNDHDSLHHECYDRQIIRLIFDELIKIKKIINDINSESYKSSPTHRPHQFVSSPYQPKSRPARTLSRIPAPLI